MSNSFFFEAFFQPAFSKSPKKYVFLNDFVENHNVCLKVFHNVCLQKKIMKQCSFVFQLSLSMITLKTTMLTCKKAKKQPSLVFQLFSRLIFNIFSVMCTLEKDTFYAHNPLNFNITCSNFNTT